MQRAIKITFVNGTPQIHDTFQAVFLRHCRHMFEIDWRAEASLMSANLQDIDLLILQARHIDADGFEPWLQRQENYLVKNCQIPVPCLILRDMGFDELSNIYLERAQKNWYVDILGTEEVHSLPIRIANLLRIYDHLRELQRYESSVLQLQSRVEDLEKQLRLLQQSIGN